MAEWNGIFRLFRFPGTLGRPCEEYPNFRNFLSSEKCLG